MGFIDFDKLPEVNDFFTTPVYNKNITDMTALALRGQATRNPLAGGLQDSIGNLNNAIGQISALEKKMEDAKKAQQRTSFGVDRFTSITSGVLSTKGLASTQLGRAENAARSNPTLQSAVSAMKTGKSQMVSALGQANRMLDHSRLMTENIPTMGGIVNDAISAASRYTSDIPGGLPSNFPNKIPSYLRSATGGAIPNFGGLSLPSLPNVDLPSINLPAMPNVTQLTGVSIPGVPNPTDILEGFTGSFTGAGPGLVGGLKDYASKVPELTESVTDIVDSLNVEPLNALGDIAAPALPAAIPSPANLASIANFTDVTGGLGNLAGGLSGMVGGEQGGIFAATCSSLQLGGGCGGLPSLSDATGLVSSLTSLASTASTAKLVDAVTTGPMKTLLASEITSKLPAIPDTGSLVSQAQGAISGAVSAATSGGIPGVGAVTSAVGAGRGIIGGALSSVNSSAAVQAARSAVGQGRDVVGGVVARGRDAVTQAQTLAADSISEAQVAAKAVANNTVDQVKDRAAETAEGVADRIRGTT